MTFFFSAPSGPATNMAARPSAIWGLAQTSPPTLLKALKTRAAGAWLCSISGPDVSKPTARPLALGLRGLASIRILSAKDQACSQTSDSAADEGVAMMTTSELEMASATLFALRSCERAGARTP